MGKVSTFYDWFVGLGGCVATFDTSMILERLNPPQEKPKNRSYLKQFNHVFKDERYY